MKIPLAQRVDRCVRKASKPTSRKVAALALEIVALSILTITRLVGTAPHRTNASEARMKVANLATLLLARCDGALNADRRPRPRKTAEILEERGNLPAWASDPKITPPRGANGGPKAIWDYQLGFSNFAPTNRGRHGSHASRLQFDDYRARLLDSIRSFERLSPLSSNTFPVAN